MKFYPFQEKAIDWLSKRPKAYLAAKMGLGKSGIAITAVEKANAFPCLVVCPGIARAHWLAEIKKWAPKSQWDFEIVSYEGAIKLTKDKNRKKYKTIIFDEAHYLKNHTAIRTKLLILNKNALAVGAERVYFLSGTPVPNHIAELWAPLYSIGAIKERFSAFAQRYCEFEKVWIGKREPITKISGNFKARMPELKKRLENHVLQISYAEARIDLPQVIFETYAVEGGYHPHQTTTERQGTRLFDDVMAKAGVDEFSALSALAPSISTLRRLHAIRKVHSCAKLIEEELSLGLYDKVIVFAHHQEVIEELYAKLTKAEISTVFVYGGTPQTERYLSIDKFQNDPRCRVYIGSILASGTAVNLHATNQIIFIEQSFVPGENAQAIARSARIGQKEKTVNVRWLTLLDSGVDNRIAEILLKKTEDLKSFEK